MNAALFIDITLWGSVAVLAFMVWKRGRVNISSQCSEMLLRLSGRASSERGSSIRANLPCGASASTMAG